MFDSYSSPSHLDAPRWCPVCAVVLRAFERNGIEMDYCPQCNGVWLDQGELDRLIQTSIQVTSVEPHISSRENGINSNLSPTVFSTAPNRVPVTLPIIEAEWETEASALIAS